MDRQTVRHKGMRTLDKLFKDDRLGEMLKKHLTLLGSQILTDPELTISTEKKQVQSTLTKQAFCAHQKCV